MGASQGRLKSDGDFFPTADSFYTASKTGDVFFLAAVDLYSLLTLNTASFLNSHPKKQL